MEATPALYQFRILSGILQKVFERMKDLNEIYDLKQPNT